MLAEDTRKIARVIERYARAWSVNDRAALVDSYHGEFTLHYFGKNPLAGTHRGKAVALAVLTEVARRTNRKLLEIVDATAGSRRGAIVVREAFEKDGRSIELERVLVYTVKDHQLHECWVYDQDQALVDDLLRQTK